MPAARERTMLRIARVLGKTAVPLCSRELASASNSRARWASRLLLHIARDDQHNHRRVDDNEQRVVDTVVALSSLSCASDATKLRCLALLTDLGVGHAASPVLSDPENVGRHTLLEVCGTLETREHVARAVDKLVENMESEELLDLIDGLSATEPGRTKLLLDEMLARADIDEQFRREIRRLRAPLLPPAEPATLRIARGPVRALIATRDDDRLLLIAAQRRPGSNPPRWRALSCLIDERGRLIDALHQGDHTRGGVDRELIRPLSEQGYVFRDSSRADVAQRLCRAARATSNAGGQVPNDYYLGRDLVGLCDEHLTVDLRLPNGVDLTALLGRAVDLLAIGEHARALPLLERYVAAAPDDAHASSNLGLCLLALDEPRQARDHLERAVSVAPTAALHHWNLASCAHRETRRGACYLSLVDYLCQSDEEPDARRRRVLAGAFVSEYERFAQLEFPGTAPRNVARAEDYMLRARELPKDQVDSRIAELQKAVDAAPAHHPSWAELGMAYADARQLSDARRSLERALTLRMDYPPALDALQLVIQLRACLYTDATDADANRSETNQRATAESSGARSRQSQRQRRR